MPPDLLASSTPPDPLEPEYDALLGTQQHLIIEAEVLRDPLHREPLFGPVSAPVPILDPETMRCEENQARWMPLRELNPASATENDLAT